jgi:hypothetical protein
MAVLLEQFGGTTRVVELRVMGLHRASQARVTAIDAQQYRFEHTSRNDGNASFTLRTWQVKPLGTNRSEVQVSWSGNPRSFWRRLLIARVRRPQLADEVQVSLAVLAEQFNAISPR